MLAYVIPIQSFILSLSFCLSFFSAIPLTNERETIERHTSVRKNSTPKWWRRKKVATMLVAFWWFRCLIRFVFFFLSFLFWQKSLSVLHLMVIFWRLCEDEWLLVYIIISSDVLNIVLNVCFYLRYRYFSSTAQIFVCVSFSIQPWTMITFDRRWCAHSAFPTISQTLK